jgi:hypothetical protein
MICQDAGFTEYTHAWLEPAMDAVHGEPLVVE